MRHGIGLAIANACILLACVTIPQRPGRLGGPARVVPDEPPYVEVESRRTTSWDPATLACMSLRLASCSEGDVGCEDAMRVVARLAPRIVDCLGAATTPGRVVDCGGSCTAR